MKRKPSIYSAFTIIELLVVTGIVAIVAATLFPVLSQVRRRSQTIVCTSNLRQLGQGIAMYSSDWDGGMPYAPDPLSKTVAGDVPIWSDPILLLDSTIPYDVRTLLRPYGCDLTLYHCPLDQNFIRSPGEKSTFFEICGSSYWYDQNHALTGYKLSDYPTPSTNVIMSDLDFFHLGRGSDIDLFTKGTTNLLFVDFHVKAYAWQDRTEFIDAIP